MLNYFRTRAATNGRYTLAGHLTGHTGPVHAIAICPDGRFAGSGGKC